MKSTHCLLTALALLVAAPALAKTDPEFPSRSIRPIISTSEADRAIGQVAPERRVTPTPERLAAPNPRYCARPYNARDSRDEIDRRACQPENSVATESNIPQLRAFRQPTTQRFAP